jgi:non-canonical purine NTP pyrophosphatase (RdgB/HAM1 family)
VTAGTLLFVTGNPGKAREAARLLGRAVTARALDLPERQSLDFREVARAKALEAARIVGETVLVEDSGLAVDAWNGFPGPLTRWLTASAGEGGLARMLDAFPDRRAQAVSVLAVASPGCAEEEVVLVEGRVAGSIAPAPRGAGGFGWDVIFVPDGETRTFAEMTDQEKDARSHRAAAFAALAATLRA